MIERALCLRMPWKNFLPCLPRHSSVNRVCYGYEGGALLVYLCNGQAIVYLLHFRVLCTKCLRICQKDFFAAQYLSNVIFLVAKLLPITVNTILDSPTWLRNLPKKNQNDESCFVHRIRECTNTNTQIHKYWKTLWFLLGQQIVCLPTCRYGLMGRSWTIGWWSWKIKNADYHQLICVNAMKYIDLTLVHRICRSSTKLSEQCSVFGEHWNQCKKTVKIKFKDHWPLPTDCNKVWCCWKIPQIHLYQDGLVVRRFR